MELEQVYCDELGYIDSETLQLLIQTGDRYQEILDDKLYEPDDNKIGYTD